MGEEQSTEIISKGFASKTYAACRSQKRKCSKTLPRCSRCAKAQTECNYDWYLEDQQQRLHHRNPLANFLFFHVPVTGDHRWLPCTLETLQQYQRNHQSRKLDFDHFLVGLMMTILFESRDSTNRLLEVYFRHIHFWILVIHKQSLQMRIAQLESKPHAETAYLVLVIQLLMKVGNSDAESGNRESDLHYLCKYLFFLLQHAREPSLELIQAGLLLAVYEVGSGNVRAASLSIGSCARLGYILRLNDDQMDSTHAFPFTVRAEEQRRVWVGVYMMDRLIHQVAGNLLASHVVDELPSHFRLPAADCEWDSGFPNLTQSSFLPTVSIQTDIPLSPFAREFQAVRTLGWVQMLPKLTDPAYFSSQFEKIDTYQVQFLKHLFKQAPGSWEILCGANAIALLATIALHRARIGLEVKSLSADIVRSNFALRSIVKMITDICIQYNGHGGSTKQCSVSLPAIICTGEAGLAASWLNQVSKAEAHLDVRPLRKFLKDGMRFWNIADRYLTQMASPLVQ